MFVGDSHNCAFHSDRTLVCWGSNDFGQASPPEQPEGRFRAVSAGRLHTCAIRADGTLGCWGYNGWGQASPPHGTFTEVSAGGLHTCAIRADGTLACWGRAGNGVTSPPDGTFTEVSAGDLHTCAVRTDRTLSCWGNDLSAESSPRAGRFSSISAGHVHTCGVRTDSTLACWGSNAFGQASPPIGTFSTVSVAGDHSCAVRTDGTVMCWGADLFGELGAAPESPSPAPPLGKVGRPYHHQFDSFAGNPPGGFSITAGSLPPGLTFSGGGQLSGTPSADGEFRFTVGASNGLFADASTPFTLSIEPAETSPVAHDDSYTATAGSVLAVSLPGVLGNDTDGEADALQAHLSTAPGHGSLTMALDGSFTYLADPGFAGTDSFTYRARDGRLSSAAATVRIIVEQHNVAPNAAADAYRTQQGSALAVPAPGVLGNDRDGDGDPLSALVGSRPGHGTLTLNPNGSFRYLPADGFAGVDRFSYRARDGVLTSRAVTVTLRVTALPTCGGRVATLVGSAAADVLRGTSRPDVIVALGGNDVVTGHGGGDLVCAGGGNDRVFGGPGNDRLLGGRGVDVLRGGPGRDRLVQEN